MRPRLRRRLRVRVASDATVYEPAKPQPQPAPDMPAATVAESAAMASSVTVPQVAKPTPRLRRRSQPQAPASKSKAGLLIGVGVVFVLIVGRRRRRVFSVEEFEVDGRRELMQQTPTILRQWSMLRGRSARYWLELEPRSEGGQQRELRAWCRLLQVSRSSFTLPSTKKVIFISLVQATTISRPPF